MEDRELLDHLLTRLTAGLRGAEILTAAYAGEDSDFVRFNRGAVRQAGSVHQRRLTLELIDGRRHGEATLSLTGDERVDVARGGELVARLRDQLPSLPEDPYLLVATDQPSTEHEDRAELPDPAAAIAAIGRAAAGEDHAGLWTSGSMARGFASSLGQRNWFRTASFALDWSLHLHADKAAKSLYAGQRWDDAELDRKVAWTARQLDALRRPPVDLAPDEYRAYLAPAAVHELVGMLCWDGFSLRAERTRRTPLLRMRTEGATFGPGVRLTDAVAAGGAPDFQEQGFTRPPEVVLIDGGRPAELLVSPRSAAEYEVPTNGASGDESPQALAVAPGTVPTDGVLDALGTGLYVGNLWYLNYSDRAACRTTGMTRFATFWVDGGEIVAPVNVLRFDDTAYHLLGDHLVGLTDSTEVIPDTDTYEGRSTRSARVPGVLVDRMRFTL